MVNLYVVQDKNDATVFILFEPKQTTAGLSLHNSHLRFLSGSVHASRTSIFTPGKLKIVI